MSFKYLNLITSSSGAITAQSQLNDILTKISEAMKSIRDLEYNTILLIVFPEAVNMHNRQSYNRTLEAIHSEGTQAIYEIVMSEITQAKYEELMSQYSTNPAEIKSKLAEFWGLKHDLEADKYDLEGIITEEYKRTHKET